MDDECSSAVLDEYYRPCGDLLVGPWTEGNLIAHVHDERIHAVALGCDRYGPALGDQSADFRHHYSLFFDKSTHDASKIRKIWLCKDKNSYL